MRMLLAVAVLAFAGCKKHDSAPAVGSAGSANSSGSAGPASSSAGPTGSAVGSANSAVAPTAAGAPATGDKLGSDVVAKETIGGVALGDDADKVTEALGTPTKKGELVEEAATGDTVQMWEFGSSVVKMSKHEGRWGATAMQIMAPTDWKTSRGIHIGSTKAEVLAAYDGEVQEDGVLVGSIYGGEMFTIEDGKVRQIYLGAMAE